MDQILIFGIVAMIGIVGVAGLLNRLLDFDELPVAGERDRWRPTA